MKDLEITKRQQSEIDFYSARSDYVAEKYPDENLVLRVSEIDNWSGKWGFAYRLLGKDGWERKKLLDIGCGSGQQACYFAMKGANVSAIDIYPDAIALTLRRAILNGVADKVEAYVAAAERLPYPNDYFDLIFCGLILHHVDVEITGKEMARVLKPRGRVVCVETSALNPLLMLARHFLPGKFGIARLSTPLEKPLSFSEVKNLGAYFSSWRYQKGQDLLSMLGRIFTNNQKLNRILSNLDRSLFRILPFSERYAYHVVLEFVK